MVVLYYDEDTYKWYGMDWGEISSPQSLYQMGLITLEEYVDAINSFEQEYDDLEEVIRYIINNAKNTQKIYVSELDRFYSDITNTLKEDGYIYHNEKSFNKMGSLEYSTLVASQKGFGLRCYNIKVKKSAHSKFIFYDLTKIITGTKSDVMKSYAQDTSSICYAYLRAIHLLNVQTEKITKSKMVSSPPTITSYAGRCLYHLTYRKNLNFIDKEVIPDELFIYDLSEEHNQLCDSTDWFANGYHGGINWKKNGDRVCKYLNVVIYDYNSLYAAAMMKPLPLGKIFHNYGKPDDIDFKLADEFKICMWVRVEIDIELLPNGIPFVHPNSTKFSDGDQDVWLNNARFFNITEPVTKSDGKIECTFCYPDYLLLKKNYSVISEEFKDYCISPASDKIFERYINKFYEAKSKQKGGARETSKKLLVTIYGTMCKSKYTYNIIEDEDDPKITQRKVSYIHIGSYISSWARYILLTGAEGLDTLHYMDTDSYHTEEEYKHLKCSDKLGDLKIEGTADVGYYFKKKCYMHLKFEDNKLKVKITKAGTSRSSIKNLSNMIECMYNNYELINEFKESFHKTMSEVEGYDYAKTEQFLQELQSIVENNEYEKMADLVIPVYYKKKTAPYQYRKVIVWEKFTYSILDDIM